MKIRNMAALLALAALCCHAGASAPVITIGGIDAADGSGLTSSMAGASVVDFSTGLPSNYSGGLITNMSNTGYDAPVGDSTNYLVVGDTPGKTGPAVANFSQGLTYFGFYLGSPDVSNKLIVTTADGQRYTITGDELIAASQAGPGGLAAYPSGSADVSFYVNLSASGSPITQIAFSSVKDVFETDNHAFISAVPEPSTSIALLAGLVLTGTLARRRRR